MWLRFNANKKERLILTLTPSFVYAEQPWICHGRSRIWCNDKPSVISDALAALSKSCLLAKTSNGTLCNFSSSNNSDNSYTKKKNKKFS